MKNSFLHLAMMLIGLTIVGAAEQLPQKAAKTEPSPSLVDNLRWDDLQGAPPGSKVSPLWGDMGTSAYGVIIRLPAGTIDPLHTHTSDFRALIISGSFWIASEAGEKKFYGQGSYVFAPAGWRHTSGTDGGVTMFQEGPAKFDIMPVEVKKEEVKKK